MKKFVKPLVIAASVAAVAGIGAVSFAKWEGGTKATDAATGTLATITFAGFANSTATVESKTLIPYNQVEGITSDMTKALKVTLPTITSVNAWTIKVEATTTNLDSGSKLYVQITDSDSAPATTTTSGWNEIDASAGYTTASQTAGASAKQMYAYILLESEEEADMGKTFTVKFTLAEASA